MKIHSIWDNGGETADRYTVYYKGRGTVWFAQICKITLRMCRVMSEHPTHPQGVGTMCDGIPGKHNGKKITFADLPKECQAVVINDIGKENIDG